MPQRPRCARGSKHRRRAPLIHVKLHNVLVCWFVVWCRISARVRLVRFEKTWMNRMCVGDHASKAPTGIEHAKKSQRETKKAAAYAFKRFFEASKVRIIT